MEHTHSTEEAGFEYKKVKVTPETESLLTDPISLVLEFTSKIDTAVEVELQFIADCVNKKIATKLAGCLQKVSVGSNTTSFTDVPFTLPPTIDKNVLANIGLTVIIIRTQDTELGRLTMTTDVKSKEDKFYRIVYNPLE